MGVGTTLGVVGGTLGAAGIGAAASMGAANTQAGAATNAAQLQYASAQQALDFQKQQFAQQQQNIAPWLRAGQGGIGTLSWLLGVPGSGGQGQINNLPPVGGGGYTAAPGTTTAPQLTGGPLMAPGGTGVPQTTGGPVMTPTASSRMLLAPGGTDGVRSPVRGPTGGLPPGVRNPVTGQPLAGGGGQPIAGGTPPGGFGSLLQGWNQPFVPPTGATEQNDPGYQFRLRQGLGALQNSAAARGGLLSGNTLQGIEQYAQDYASNEYQNVYNRSLGQYQQSYNIFQNNQANEFNRLAALSGIGQTATGQLSSAGQAAAGNIGNILLGSSQNIGNTLQNAAYQRGSGYAQLGNIAGNTAGNINQLLLGIGSGQIPNPFSDNIDWNQISWG